MEPVGVVAAIVVAVVLVAGVVALVRQGHPEKLSDTAKRRRGPTGEQYPPGSGPAGPGAERMTDLAPADTESPGPPTDRPLAIERIPEIRTRLGAGPTVFLDYDGTLTPIVDDPSQATIGDHERRVLGEMARLLPVAIVSGRALEDVKRQVGVDGLLYAGSHGFEIEGRDGERFEGHVPAGLTDDLSRAEEMIGSHDLAGVFVERKPYTIAVHTRRAESEEERGRARDLAQRIAAEFDSLTVRGGKEVHEIRPSLDWDKGKAVGRLLEALPGDPRPLYIGDDETDEDAFAMVRLLGGVGIVVQDSAGPVESAADYRLTGPAQTIDFLSRLTGSID